MLGVRLSPGQKSPVEPAKDSGPTAEDELAPDGEDGGPPTAEELLDALRRARPSREIIPPAGTAAFPPPSDSGKLLPESAAVVDRTGRLARDGEWWVFIADPPTGEPTLKLLPNVSLEVMVRMTTGGNHVMRFVVSGEVTVFRDENYLLVRLFRRASRPQLDELASSPEGAMETSEARRVEDGGDRESHAGMHDRGAEGDRDRDAGRVVEPTTPPSAEDVLAALQRQEVPEPVMPAEARPGPAEIDRAAEATGGSSMALSSRYLLPEGATIVHRAGRLVRDGAWWRFVFESDHRGFPEPPMKVLPGRGLELMIAAWEENAHGLLFQISGEVTLFEGENYLLPHVAYRQIATGNVRK